MTRRGIYVETRINASLDEVWALTQDPAQHVRWDARFSETGWSPLLKRVLRLPQPRRST